MAKRISHPKINKSYAPAALLAVLLLLTFGCAKGPPTVESSPPISNTPLLEADDITFFLKVPDQTPDNLPIHLILLDEVTGLPFNQQIFRMQRMEAYRYGITVRVPHQVVLKYRYAAGEMLDMKEFTALGEAVRYRMYFADGPGFTDDMVAAWNAGAENQETGRIIGRVVQQENGRPIADLLVVCSGVQGVTAMDGSFHLEGVPRGKHHLVVYAMDGSQHTYQQDVVTAAEATTPVEIAISRTQMVEVTFTVTTPDDTVPTVPIKLAGNLRQMGNTFADLAGGMSLRGDELPEMRPLGNGRYSLSMQLPAGIYIEYKYTMGDGFWDAEHHPDGRYVVRKMIVPRDSTQFAVDDEIPTWRSSNSAPVWFDLVQTGKLPASEVLYIQFKLVEWTEPLPMWPGGEGRWGYLLTSPTNFSAPLPYRFCRNGQCGGDAGAAVEENGKIYSIPAKLPPNQTLQTVTEQWKWYTSLDVQAVIPAVDIRTRSPGFSTGVELSERGTFVRGNQVEKTFGAISNLHANLVVLTPTWTAKQQTPPILDPMPGNDLSSFELLEMIRSAQVKGLSVSLNPGLVFPMPASDWWATAPRDFPWWQVWFQQYRRFALHHAEIAQQAQAASLILGGRWLMPSFPQGTLIDGSPSNVPADFADRWVALLGEIRSIYTGEVYLNLDLQNDIGELDDLLDLVDGVYLQFSASIGDSDPIPTEVMAQHAAQLLDENAYPLYARDGLKVIIAIAYPSADGAASGCIQSPGGACIPFELLSPFELDFETVELDLNEQAEVYTAILLAINERPWIEGVISRGYFPHAALLDKSISVYGKPAYNLLWYWYKQMLGLD